MPEKRSRPRMCVGCGRKRDKGEMIRISRSPEGEVKVDPSGRSPGRGAYICPSHDCFLAARKKRSLEKALGSALGEEVCHELEEYLKSCSGNRAD